MKASVAIISKLIFLFFLLFNGCAAPYQYSYKGHNTFTPENIGRIKVGLSDTTLLEMFGKPDEVFDSAFGQDTGAEWSGTVWIYFAGLDSRFKYVKRYKKNMFVYCKTENGLRLNHWEIEGY